MTIEEIEAKYLAEKAEEAEQWLINAFDSYWTMDKCFLKLIEVAKAAEYLLDHVNRDYSEWKEPLEKALKDLENA